MRCGCCSHRRGRPAVGWQIKPKQTECGGHDSKAGQGYGCIASHVFLAAAEARSDAKALATSQRVVFQALGIKTAMGLAPLSWRKLVRSTPSSIAMWEAAAHLCAGEARRRSGPHPSRPSSTARSTCHRSWADEADVYVCPTAVSPRLRRQLYLIMLIGISRMIIGKASRIATLMMSTNTNQPQPRKMSPMLTSLATPLST
jgi:hypothetical protein